MGKFSKRAVQELAQKIYNSSDCPRSMDDLIERVKLETGGELPERRLRRLAKKVADANVEKE